MARSNPYYLTVAEVMEIFPLGRSAVYELARRYVATGGAEGIPCQRFGRRLLFPVAQIEAVIGRPVDGALDAPTATPEPVITSAAAPASTSNRDDDAPSLFD